MTENGLDIQTISTKRTDFQTDRVLLFGQLTIEKGKALPSHFLKFLLANRTNGTFGFAHRTCRPFAKPKEPFFFNALFGSSK
jgi:hypothetical protein